MTRNAACWMVAACLMAGGAAAAPACVAPTPPDVALRPAKLVPPERSPCVDAKQGTPGCLGWESHSYNDAIKAFNAKVPTYRTAAESYVAKLNAFVQAASDYARCEVQSLQ